MCYDAVHAPGCVIIAIFYWKKYWLVIFSSLWFRVGNRLHPLGAYTFNERERARYSKWFLCNWITGNEQKVCCHETQAVPLIVSTNLSKKQKDAQRDFIFHRLQYFVHSTLIRGMLLLLSFPGKSNNSAQFHILKKLYLTLSRKTNKDKRIKNGIPRIVLFFSNVQKGRR